MRVSRCYDSIIIVAVAAEVDSVSPSLLARHACGDSSRRPVAPTDDGDVLENASDPLCSIIRKKKFYYTTQRFLVIISRGERFNLADERRERSSVDKVGSGMDLEAFVREISELVTVPLSSPLHITTVLSRHNFLRRSFLPAAAGLHVVTFFIPIPISQNELNRMF